VCGQGVLAVLVLALPSQPACTPTKNGLARCSAAVLSGAGERGLGLWLRHEWVNQKHQTVMAVTSV
jgi:hypothetical protein